MIKVSICKQDIPASAWFESKNGKEYLTFIVDKMKEPDQYGKTHTVYLSQTEEERKSKARKDYIGKGQEYEFQRQPQRAQPEPKPRYAEPDPIGADDLPF